MLRSIARACWAFVFLATVATGAAAQAWPSKPVRLVVPFPPGSAPDIIARLVSEKLAAAWSQPVVVDNRPGAGGIVAMSGFVRAPADGYTLTLVPASTVTLTPHLFKDPQFDVDRDLVAVANVGLSPMMIAAHPAAGVSSLTELVQRAKAQPGKLNASSPSVNTLPHLTTEMLNRAAGIELYPVPYNGSVGSATAAVTGDAVITIDGLPPLVPHVKAGKLRPIAVTSLKRLPGYESVPTAAETFPGFESVGWFVMFAPAGTPAAVVERINADVNRVTQMPDIVARFAELGVYPNPGTPREAAEFVNAQRGLWKKVVQDVGLKPQ